MTIEDLSEYLQIPKTKVRHLMNQSNGIPYHDNHGFLRFNRKEIDQWMMTPIKVNHEPSREEFSFVYDGRPIKSYKLSGSVIFLSQDSWERLPDFVEKVVRSINEKERPYLYREEFESFIDNYGDYLNVCCQLGFIDSKREDGRKKHYYPTEYSRKIYNKRDPLKIRKIILHSILNIVKNNKEKYPKERHSIYLLWYILKIKQKGMEPEEFHFRKLGEKNMYPRIRLGYSTVFCDFLFGGDRKREQEFLDEWESVKKKG